MLCECGQHQATIHEFVIRNGQKVERHLCDQCASKHGVTTDPQVPISQLISNYIKGKSTSVPTVGDDTAEPSRAPAGRAGACPGCSLTFAEFKKHGLLSCARCYDHFGSRLGPLIARAHEGAEQHIGKVPRRVLKDVVEHPDPERLATLLGDNSDRERRLATVRSRLARALDREEYEQAAMLRDELTRIASLPGADAEEPAATDTSDPDALD